MQPWYCGVPEGLPLDVRTVLVGERVCAFIPEA
jgi:hypothetical protein